MSEAAQRPQRQPSPRQPAPDAVILVLCGWAGSQEKHLLVYEALLRRVLSETNKTAHIEAIRCSLPLRLIFSPVESYRTSWVLDNVIIPLQSCVERLQGTSRAPRVLVHAFSNGGGFVVEQIVKLYDDPKRSGQSHRRLPQLPPIAAIIFDSAPGYDGGEMGQRVLAEVLGTDSWYQRAGIRVAHATQRLVAHVINSNRQKDYWQLMVDVGELCPTLHLYSKDDHLCDAGKLHELIMTKINRGMDVQYRCWDVSRHCSHYRLHQAEYEESVTAFLARVLGGDGGVDSDGRRIYIGSQEPARPYPRL